MKATLITHTSDHLQLLYAQTRMTTSSAGFAAVYANPTEFFPRRVRETLKLQSQDMMQDAWNETERWEMERLVGEALDAGHWSVARGVSFTFSIECSRSAGRQLLRHVIGVAWEEQSQRFVKLLKREYLEGVKWQIHAAFDETDYTPHEREVAWAALCSVVGKVFEIPPLIRQRGQDDPEAHGWFHTRVAEMEQYLSEIESGIPAEDARENLPNCTITQMVSTWSYEALHTFLAKRLCTRAQLPIRTLAKQMRKQIFQLDPFLARHLSVQCLPACICPEARPDGCSLLLENGGNVLRKEQAADAVKSYALTYKQEHHSI